MVFPYKCVIKNAEKTIKYAAELNDEDLYNEIKDLDLIPKEFRYHNKYYNKNIGSVFNCFSLKMYLNRLVNVFSLEMSWQFLQENFSLSSFLEL